MLNLVSCLLNIHLTDLATVIYINSLGCGPNSMSSTSYTGLLPWRKSNFTISCVLPYHTNLELMELQTDNETLCLWKSKASAGYFRRMWKTWLKQSSKAYANYLAALIEPVISSGRRSWPVGDEFESNPTSGIETQYRL